MALPGVATMCQLKKRQREIFQYVVSYFLQHRLAPTYQEIGSHFGGISKTTVFEHVLALERLGYLKRTKFRARSLQVLKVPAGFHRRPGADTVGERIALTPRQLAILDWIIAFIAERHTSPRLVEISAQFGRTKVTVLGHLNELVRRGCIQRENFPPCAITVLYHPPPAALPTRS